MNARSPTPAEPTSPRFGDRGEDAVEAALVSSILSTLCPSRTLEAGTGRGRLTALLGRWSPRVVGIDIDGETLRGFRRSGVPGPTDALATADVHRLPFRSGSFDCVVMVRVYHRLESPSQALAEARRVLRPGGHLLLSCHPRPSFRTVYQDVTVALRNRGGGTSLTFARSPVVEVPWGARRGWVETRRTTERRLIEAGFEVRSRFVTGFEELPLGRFLPAERWIRWSGPRIPPPLAPCLFFLAQRVELRCAPDSSDRSEAVREP